eukprot:TRINITY_DN8795_c0_g1_i2.p1 TRINITY_DN8795_c0_g1~~TRINITY_DN8795_c0_g1_i2.p1  ORF type:complete len:224 (-),score=59.70 TRINITY_DN8795_c0_g1_i2:160-831(-)
MALNNRPIIGIVTQPARGRLDSHGTSYIAASYVKFVEGGGARVIPIFHNSTKEELTSIFGKINGVLFPGGGNPLDNVELSNTLQHMLDLTKQAFDQGDHFPLFAHCLGFELLAMITSNDANILSSCDTRNVSLNLDFTPAIKTSKWLQDADPKVLHILSSQNVTMNQHQKCISMESFIENSDLQNFWTVLSTNLDRNGKKFISTWESTNYPVYGIQWHAEKNQ